MDTLPEAQGIRGEERLTDGTYVLLAELPGVDPNEGIEITVTGDVLDLRAQRSVMTTENRGTKVLHGHFTPLPAGAKSDETAAEYKHGLLTITVPVPPADHRRSLRS